MKTKTYQLVKQNKWYDPEGLNLQDPPVVMAEGSHAKMTAALLKVRADKLSQYPKNDNVDVGPISQNEDFEVYYRSAITKDIFSVRVKPETFEEKIERLNESDDRIHDRETMKDMAKDFIDRDEAASANNIIKALGDSDAEWFCYDWSMGNLEEPVPLETLDDLSDWK